MSKDTLGKPHGIPVDVPKEAANGSNGESSQSELTPVEILTRGTGETGFELSSQEVRTLQGMLRLIKAARVETNSKNPKVAVAALERMAYLFSYINGFFDGKGITARSFNPGFQNVFQSSLVVVDPDAQLDAAIKSLEDMINTPTRAVPVVVGAGLRIGIGLIIGGITMKTIGEIFKDLDPPEKK